LSVNSPGTSCPSHSCRALTLTKPHTHPNTPSYVHGRPCLQPQQRYRRRWLKSFPCTEVIGRAAGGHMVSISCCCTSHSPSPCCFAWLEDMHISTKLAVKQLKESSNNLLPQNEGGVGFNWCESARLMSRLYHGPCPFPFPSPQAGHKHSRARDAPPLPKAVPLRQGGASASYTATHTGAAHAGCPWAVCRGVHRVFGKLSWSYMGTLPTLTCNRAQRLRELQMALQHSAKVGGICGVVPPPPGSYSTGTTHYANCPLTRPQTFVE